MTCAPTDRIMQTLRTRVAGAADPMIELELFNTMDEFLRRTSAWKSREAIVIVDGVDEYPVPLPADSTLVRVMGISYNGVPVPSSTSGSVTQSSTGVLTPEMTFPDGDANYAPFRTDIDPDTQIFSYSLFKPTYISITNPPQGEQRYPLDMVIALSVATSCIECDCGDWQVPEWMFEMYFQDWLDGTLARLYSMPSKPWTNLVNAQYHGKRFRNSMGYRKQEAARGFAYDVPTWSFPRSGWP